MLEQRDWTLVVCWAGSTFGLIVASDLSLILTDVLKNTYFAIDPCTGQQYSLLCEKIAKKTSWRRSILNTLLDLKGWYLPSSACQSPCCENWISSSLSPPRWPLQRCNIVGLSIYCLEGKILSSINQCTRPGNEEVLWDNGFWQIGHWGTLAHTKIIELIGIQKLGWDWHCRKLLSQ